jgi:hypothetical protein
VHGYRRREVCHLRCSLGLWRKVWVSTGRRETFMMAGARGTDAVRVRS